MYFAILRSLKRQTYCIICKNCKISYCNDLPLITAPANKGQDLQVPSRPLSRGYTVVKDITFGSGVVIRHSKSGGTTSEW